MDSKYQMSWTKCSMWELLSLLLNTQRARSVLATKLTVELRLLACDWTARS